MTAKIPSIQALIATHEERQAAKPVRKPRLTAADIAPGTRVEFQRDTCSRCLGSGSYPSAAWNGVCLGCNGKGKSLTQAGREAKKIHDAWVAEHLTLSVRDIKVGMKIKPNPVDGYMTITEVGEPHVNGRSRIGGEGAPWVDSVHITVQTLKSGGYSLLADGTVQRKPSEDEMRELVARLAHLKGIKLVAP